MGWLQRKAEEQEKEMGEVGKEKRNGGSGERKKRERERERNSTLLGFWWQCQLTTMRS